MKKIDHSLLKVIQSQESVDRIWAVTRDIIIERLSRKPKRKRPSIAEPKLLEWVECMDPEIDLDGLPDYTRERILDYEELK